jgi:hypothetical protein
MSAELTKQANDLAQNVFVSLGKAVSDASAGVDYSNNWEQAMQYQVELLRAMNDLKYKQTKLR